MVMSYFARLLFLSCMLININFLSAGSQKEARLKKNLSEKSQPKKTDFAFQNLKDAELNLEFSTEKITQRKSVWIVFQKGCATCHKVMRESSCYSTNPDVDVLALGLYDSAQDLLKDARTNGYQGTVLTSKNAVDLEQGMEVTPTIFIFSKDKLIKRFDSYASCKKIIKALES